VNENGEYHPPYAVRKSKRKAAEPTSNHVSPNATSSKVTLSPKAKGKARASNHLSPPRAPTRAPRPTSRLPEPFTLTLAAALASPLPLPFDRRRIELIVSWSTPEGLWSYVPFAKYIPAWDVHLGGTRARICAEGDEVQSAFEVRGLVREFVKCIPIVGRFYVWL